MVMTKITKEEHYKIAQILAFLTKTISYTKRYKLKGRELKILKKVRELNSLLDDKFLCEDYPNEPVEATPYYGVFNSDKYGWYQKGLSEWEINEKLDINQFINNKEE